MPSAKKAPAKTTATKTTNFKSLPFGVDSTHTKTVVMPNGQTVKQREVHILKGMLHLEAQGRGSGTGETAVSIAQRLLNSKKKAAALETDLTNFIIENSLIDISKK